MPIVGGVYRETEFVKTVKTWTVSADTIFGHTASDCKQVAGPTDTRSTMSSKLPKVASLSPRSWSSAAAFGSRCWMWVGNGSSV